MEKDIKALCAPSTTSGGLTIRTVVFEKDLEDTLRIWKSFEEEISVHEVSEFVTAPDSEPLEQVEQLLNACELYYEVYGDNSQFSIEIEWGDWKHDHGFCDHLIETVFGRKCINEEVTEEDGSDAYSAVHTY